VRHGDLASLGGGWAGDGAEGRAAGDV